MIFGASRSRRPRAASRDSRRVEAEVHEDLPPKLIPSIRQLVSTAVSLAHTRLALAGIELEEELQRLIGAAVLAFVALVFAFLALVVATFTIVLAVPEEYRVATMIGITVLYVVLVVGAVLRLKGIFSDRPPIFGATLAELEKDKETLASMARAHEAGEAAEEALRSRQRVDAGARHSRAGTSTVEGAH